MRRGGKRERRGEEDEAEGRGWGRKRSEGEGKERWEEGERDEELAGSARPVDVTAPKNGLVSRVLC